MRIPVSELPSDIPCHAICEPVDQLNKGKKPESDAQSHDAPKLEKGHADIIFIFSKCEYMAIR